MLCCVNEVFLKSERQLLVWRTNDQKPLGGFIPHRLLASLLSPTFLTCPNLPLLHSHSLLGFLFYVHSCLHMFYVEYSFMFSAQTEILISRYNFLLEYVELSLIAYCVLQMRSFLWYMKCQVKGNINVWRNELASFIIWGNMKLMVKNIRITYGFPRNDFNAAAVVNLKLKHDFILQFCWYMNSVCDKSRYMYAPGKKTVLDVVGPLGMWSQAPCSTCVVSCDW